MKKEEKQINIMKEENEEQEKFDNEFEMKGMLPRVRSLRGIINEDYTLAKLKTAEKEFMTENVENAGYIKMLLDRYWQRGYRYEWDNEGMPVKNEDGSYRKQPLTEREIHYLKEIAEKTFKTFMMKPHMIAILSRNDSENFMVKLLGKHEEQEKPVAEFDEKDKSVLGKIGDFFKGKGEEEEED